MPAAQRSLGRTAEEVRAIIEDFLKACKEPALLELGEELLNVTAENLSLALAEMLTDSAARQRQIEAFADLDTIMSTGNRPPSVRAADIVLATMRKGRSASE